MSRAERPEVVGTGLGEEPRFRFVQEWRAVDLGSVEVARHLEVLVAEAVGEGRRPDALGLLVDLQGLLEVLEVVGLDVGSEAEDRWLARGAAEAMLELWPAVVELGWPRRDRAICGLREGWLATLGVERAAALRQVAEGVDGEWGLPAERREVHERSERYRSARAVGLDAVRTGEDLLAVGEARGRVAVQVGRGLLAHVACFERLRPRWEEIERARAAAAERWRDGWRPDDGGRSHGAGEGRVC